MADVHPDDADLVEQIVNTCEELRKHGYTIESGIFGLELGPNGRWICPEKCLCPLGAMVLDKQGERGGWESVSGTAVVVLSRPGSWIDGFWQSFDGCNISMGTDSRMRGGAAGAEVRRRLLG